MTIAGKVIRFVGKALKILVGVGAAATATQTAIEEVKPIVEELINEIREITKTIKQIEVTEVTEIATETGTMKVLSPTGEAMINALNTKRNRLIKQLKS